MIIATHSSDVLLGLLDRDQPISVVRLTRHGEANAAAVLDGERVKTLWKDPVLRYSNLLDGLFHGGVVICEAEGDARLYAAALDKRLEVNKEPASDLLFTSCGGKHKAPTAVDALRPLGVPVAVIADLDVLRDDGLLRTIVTSLGGRWEDVQSDWQRLSTAVAAHPTPSPLIETVLEQITETVGDDPTARLTEQQSRRIRTITKTQDGWKQARDSGGMSALPRGDAMQVAKRLLEALRHVGLFIVPVGALEGWAPDLGGHGPGYVDRALTENRHAENSDLGEFVADVSAFLQGV